MSANPQLNARDRVKPIDPIWDSIRNEAEAAAAKDPLLTAFLYSTILNQNSLEEAVIQRISERLDHGDIPRGKQGTP